MFFVSYVSHAFASVHCCLVVVTCWESADLLALVGDVFCIFATFPFGVLGQVWCLVVWFPDLCHFSYFPQRGGGGGGVIADVVRHVILKLLA